MPEMYKRPYLDTSVYVAAFRGSPPEPEDREDIARHILDDAFAGNFSIIASTFLKAEVLGDRNNPDHADLIDRWFLNRAFVWHELDMPTAELARDLGRQHGLKPGDAVHLATAIRAGADQLLVWDNRWPKSEFEGVLVTEPHWSGQETLA